LLLVVVVVVESSFFSIVPIVLLPPSSPPCSTGVHPPYRLHSVSMSECIDMVIMTSFERAWPAVAEAV
jgi:hypothetical protein